ncbi:hypothetical protein U9180_23115, partial [Escherichia coli]
GLTALSAEFTIGEGELMAHDVPLGCAPDEYDDLISGTCSHLPWISEHNARLLVGPAVALIHYLNEMCQSTETAVNDTFCRTLTRESLAIP